MNIVNRRNNYDYTMSLIEWQVWKMLCLHQMMDRQIKSPGTLGTIGSQMITSELVFFFIVVMRKKLLEKTMLCMIKNSLPWKACPFTLGSVAWCAHCTLGYSILCDRVAPWELVCRSSYCSSCSWDVSSSDGVSWRSFVYGMSPVAMAYRDARSSMLVWQYRSKNVWFMDGGRWLDKGTQ